MARVIINFADFETAKQFAKWLDNQGEENYYDCMNYLPELEESTVDYFEYDYDAMKEESTILIRAIKTS